MILRRRAGQVLRRIRPRPLPPPQDTFNAPLYTFKAFAIATAIVVSTASASVAGVMAYLDVRNTTEFAARMRTCVAQSMPILTAKIYRRPTSEDDPPGQHDSSTTFDYDAAQQRLADAFDKGGFDPWAEAAARELEAESEIERARKHTTS
ncbi:hypothetical protein OG21DRAFT_1483767 [Imleria badia]|nr:hypothetical protein OG21DRAFT_1483767 [Imleria badia]